MTEMLPTIPVMDETAKSGSMARLNAFLDKFVLPWPVKYLTNRITILATLCLLIPLIALATNQVFVLLANSYLNVMSVVVSSTVLLYSTISEVRDRTAAQRREQLAAWHQQKAEERAEEDHRLIEQINTHIDEIHAEVMQHVTTSLDSIQQLLIERMEKLQEEDHQRITETNSNMLANMAAQQEELTQVRRILEAMRPTTD